MCNLQGWICTLHMIRGSVITWTHNAHRCLYFFSVVRTVGRLNRAIQMFQ